MKPYACRVFLLTINVSKVSLKYEQ
jgi:hypothetical protein